MAKSNPLEQYEPIIQAKAKKYDVPAEHLRALMRTEDPSGDPKIVGYDRHGHGLMQVDDRYHDASKADDPEWNIDEGARIYKQGRDYLKQNGVPDDKLDEAAFAAYNHGPENVLSHFKAGESLNLSSKGEDNGYSNKVKKNLGGGASFESDDDTKSKPTDGQHFTLLKDGRVPVLHDGDLAYVKPEQVADAVYGNGDTPLSLEQHNDLAKKRELKKKYGEGAGNAIKATAIGAANGLLPGAEALAVKTGLASPEQAQQYHESFAGPQTAAEYTSMLLSSLDGESEAAALAKGLEKKAATKEAAAVGEKTLINPKNFERATEKTAAGAPDLAGKTLVPEAETIKGNALDNFGAERGARPGDKIVEAPPEVPAAFKGVGEAAETNAGKKGARVGAAKGEPTRLNNERLPFEPHTKVEPSNSLTQGVGGFGSDEATLGANGLPMAEEVSPEGLEAIQGADNKTLADAAGGVTETGKAPTPTRVTGDIPRAFEGSEVHAVEPGQILDESLAGEPTVADATATKIPLPETQVGSPGNLDVTQGAPLDPTRVGETAPTKVGGPAMSMPGEATQVGAPAFPVAPPPEASFAKQAQRWLSKPNKAIFGMGKEFGSAVEEAAGGGLAGKLAGGAARGALESVPYTIGANANELARNNERVTPEKLVAGIGPNALFGGALGGVLGLAEHGLDRLKLKLPEPGNRLAPKDFGQAMHNAAAGLQHTENLIEQAKNDLYSPVRDAAGNVIGPAPKYARFDSLLSGSTKLVAGDGAPPLLTGPLSRVVELANDLAANAPKNAQGGLYQEAVKNFITDLKSATHDGQVMAAGDRFKQVMDEIIDWKKVRRGIEDPVNDALGGVRRDVMKTLEREDLFGGAAKFQRGLNDRMEKLYDLVKQKDGVGKRLKRAATLEAEEDSAGDKVFDPVKVGKMINGINLEGKTPGEAMSKAYAQHTEKLLGEWRDAQRDLVGYIRDEVHKPLGAPDHLANLHDVLGANDAKYAQALNDAKFVTDSQKKSALQRIIADRGTRLGAAAMLMMAGVPHAFLLTYSVSYMLEKSIGLGLGGPMMNAIADHGARMSQAIHEGLVAAVKGGKPLVGGASVGAMRGFTASPEEAKDGKDRRENVARVADHIAQVVANPEPALQRAAAATHLLATVNPELAMQTQAKAMHAIQYLATQTPKDPLPPSPFPNHTKFIPGHAETARFETIAETVANPLVVLRDLANCRLTTEQMHALDAVYPEIAEEIRTEAMNVVGEHGGEMDYQHKLAFERLTGTKVDWASSEVTALQGNFPKPPAPNPSAGGAANKPKAATSQKQMTALADQVSPGLQSAIGAG